MPDSLSILTQPDVIDRWTRPSQKKRILSTCIIIGLATVLCWGVILSGNMSGRGASDDLLYHWVAINQFAQQLPHPDISDYTSATTPGYHLLLAPLVAAGMGHTGVQLVASLWTLALFAVMAWIVSGRFGFGAIPLMLPMIASIYVLYQGIWLLPDNSGWFLVLLLVLLQLRPRTGPALWVLSGVLLVALIWLRQIHIWIAGVVWLGAWLGGRDSTPTPRAFFGSFLRRAGRTSLAMACTVPAFATLLWFVLLWGGLVPPTFHDQHQGPNTATPGFILLQLTVLSIFFAPMLVPRAAELWRTHRAWILLGAGIGLFLGLVPQSIPSTESGRYSGWWHFIALFPSVMERSPIFMLGSLIGGVCFVLWLSFAERRDAWIWTGLMLAFIAAQSANHASWQRYHEPMLLIMLLLILSRSTIGPRQAIAAIIGSIALSMILGVITINSMIDAQPIEPVPVDAVGHIAPENSPEFVFQAGIA